MYLICVPCEMCKVCESLQLHAAQADELALQCGSVRENRFNARFQTATYLGIDFNPNFVLRLNAVSELEYNV